ncbi:choice-of-anchor J domain-containing protein [Flavobacterium sp. DG1-102-2]|uniref:choice-of-anchor J domain-containing protein n=1 Tax=Flavobacterium sp. DG1-102-2 TaxID=3081663 RepID=UPI002948FEB5|nr:choice-of-anchor J domain-containing protein [Flavobacterium sp. DG1-102-2]MDV6167805.1 choice-of-anchor J domain-containing protein [Flavobacterium sp. DG1-102-2]
MKQLLQLLLLSAVMTFIACDDDTSLPLYTSLVYLEDFENVQDNTILDLSGFTNAAKVGTTLWNEQLFDGNGYAEFLSETDSPSAAWLITPPINLGTKSRTLHFQSAQHHMPQEGSSFEVFIATDYNGTDINTAHWVQLQAKTPTIYTEWYKFISSGELSLADYSGTVHIAFRASHATAGTGYYIDNIKIY